MHAFRKVCALSLSILAIATPAWASPCASPQDMSALEAAGLQQKLMVAALTCNDIAAYNNFVLSYRKELQNSDATLLAFFKKRSSEAAYHAYKTKLANGAEMSRLHDGRYCARADAAFRSAEQATSLAEVLETVPTIETGFDACYAREARADSEKPRERSNAVRW